MGTKNFAGSGNQKDYFLLSELDVNLAQLVSMIPFETRRVITSKTNALLKRRPSSAPFLAGDSYRALGNHLFDETGRCIASDIGKNDIVYVSANLLEEFKPLISNSTQPFILITHQSDMLIDDRQLSVAEEANIIHWFAQNCFLNHEKVSPLPIGLEDRWRHNNGALYDFKRAFPDNLPRIPRIAYAFTLGTNPDKRLACLSALMKTPLATELPQPLNASLYRKTIKDYLFVASPAGNGPDCHRTWEAMYLGVVPIVEDNYMHRIFRDMGAPLYIVNDWNELADWDEQHALAVYSAVRSSANLSMLELPFWMELIERVKG